MRPGGRLARWFKFVTKGVLCVRSASTRFARSAPLSPQRSPLLPGALPPKTPQQEAFGAGRWAGRAGARGRGGAGVFARDLERGGAWAVAQARFSTPSAIFSSAKASGRAAALFEKVIS